MCFSCSCIKWGIFSNETFTLWLRRRCCWSHKWSLCDSTQVLVKVSAHVCINTGIWKNNWFYAAVLTTPILLIFFNVAVFCQVPLVDSQERPETMANISISFRKSLWKIFNNLLIKVELLKQQVAFDRTQDSFPFAHTAIVFNDPVDNIIKKKIIFTV